MTFNFKLPDIGEGVAEGEIVEWLVNVGDVVAEDDPMVEVMTDKATVTIGAPRAGTISEVRFGVGDVAQVGDVIVTIAEGEGAAAAAPETPTAQDVPAPKEEEDQGPAATAVGDIREGLPGSSYFQTKPETAAAVAAPAAGQVTATGRATLTGAGAKTLPPPTATPAYFSDKPLATPATRKLARDLSLDLRTIPPSGPLGRTTRDDVKAYAGSASTQTLAAAPSVHPVVPSVRPEPVAARQASAPPSSGPLEERKPFVGIRRKIAQRMQHTKNTAAHFTFVEECDVTELIALRSRLRPAAADAGVKLSYLPFIVKAVVASLKKHPVLNSALDETTNELVYRKYFDIGIAAATPSGLMVPVVKGADQLTILELAKEIDRLGEGARTGGLDSSELTGSTFTITSLGRQGGLFATPILNHPEVGILGVHQMKQKPVVRDGQIVVGDVMLLSLSFDHRIVDGHVGAAFAYDIIGYLEQPDRLFLEMA